AAGSPEVAVDYLLASHEWEAAARLLVTLGEAEIIAGRAERLLGWIERLPGSVVAAHPILGYHMARALRRLDRVEESAQTAEQAERFALARGDRGLALLARIWQAEMLAFLGRGDEAVGTVEAIFRAFGRQGPRGALA